MVTVLGQLILHPPAMRRFGPEALSSSPVAVQPTLLRTEGQAVGPYIGSRPEGIGGLFCGGPSRSRYV